MSQPAIDSFFGYFRQELRSLESFERVQYRKILICVFLDTLAKAVFSDVQKNSERFTRFLTSFSSWPHWRRVAAFQLLYRLQHRGAVRGELYVRVARVVHEHPPYSVIRAEHEPELRELLQYASSPEEKNFVEQSTYVRLFYSLRNYLVHEGREPGGAYEFGRDIEPMYMNLTRLNEAGQFTDSKELLFPYAFMRRVIDECIERSYAHFSGLSVDPRSGFSMSSVW